MPDELDEELLDELELLLELLELLELLQLLELLELLEELDEDEVGFLPGSTSPPQPVARATAANRGNNARDIRVGLCNMAIFL